MGAAYGKNDSRRCPRIDDLDTARVVGTPPKWRPLWLVAPPHRPQGTPDQDKKKVEQGATISLIPSLELSKTMGKASCSTQGYLFMECIP